MTQRRHGETERASEGFERAMESGFRWLESHAREFMVGVFALLVIGGVAALLYESSKGRQATRQAEYEAIEMRFLVAMGSDPGALLPAEPANEKVARDAREAALADFAALAGSTSGVTRDAASLRAAEMEVDLGRFEAAVERLGQAEGDMPEGLLYASTLRLKGYALEELERFGEAAEAYTQGALVAEYPGRAILWLTAADNHERAGQLERAADALRRAQEIDPEWAAGLGLDVRRDGIEALIAR